MSSGFEAERSHKKTLDEGRGRGMRAEAPCVPLLGLELLVPFVPACAVLCMRAGASVTTVRMGVGRACCVPGTALGSGLDLGLVVCP